MFKRPQTRALRDQYKLVKFFFLSIGWSYPHDLSQTFFKRIKLPRWKLQFKSDSFSIFNGCASQMSTFYCIANHKNVISKYLENALIDFAQTSRTLKQFIKEKLRLTLLDEKFPLLWNTGAGKIGYGVISFILTPNHNKFSSLFNTAVVTIFPNLC